MMSFIAENEAQNKTFNQYGRNNPIVLLTGSRIILSLFVRGLRVAIHLKATCASTLANTVMNQIRDVYDHSNEIIFSSYHETLFFIPKKKNPVSQEREKL